MGLFGLFSRTRNGTGPAPDDFDQRLRHVVTVLDLKVIEAGSRGCSVGVPHNGALYEVAIFSTDGRQVRFMVISAIGFPPSELPTALYGTLDRMNAQMPNCQYVPHDSRTGSRFTVQGTMDVWNLTPESVLAALEEMVPRAIGLDQYLLKHGYAR